MKEAWLVVIKPLGHERCRRSDRGGALAISSTKPHLLPPDPERASFQWARAAIARSLLLNYTRASLDEYRLLFLTRSVAPLTQFASHRPWTTTPIRQKQPSSPCSNANSFKCELVQTHEQEAIHCLVKHETKISRSEDNLVTYLMSCMIKTRVAIDLELDPALRGELSNAYCK